jgi:hypothetical protein
MAIPENKTVLVISQGETRNRDETPSTSRGTGEVATSRSFWVLAVLGLVQFMIVIDNTIVNVALPSIQRDLHFAASDLAWVVDGYLLTAGGLLLLGGRLGDLFGQRRLFLIGTAVFALASLGSGLALTRLYARDQPLHPGGRRSACLSGGALAGGPGVFRHPRTCPRARHLGWHYRHGGDGRGGALRSADHPGELALELFSEPPPGAGGPAACPTPAEGRARMAQGSAADRSAGNRAGHRWAGGRGRWPARRLALCLERWERACSTAGRSCRFACFCGGRDAHGLRNELSSDK